MLLYLGAHLVGLQGVVPADPLDVFSQRVDQQVA